MEREREGVMAAGTARADEERLSAWERETVPRVMEIVGARLSQRDLYSLLLTSPWCYRALLSNPQLWKVLDLRETKSAGSRLLAALSLERYKDLKVLNMEFAQDIDDTHLVLVKTKGFESLKGLGTLNLNACQKVSDRGIEAITSICPNLSTLSLYWNVGLTDNTIKHIVRNCQKIIDLNLSGCKNITDQSLLRIADSFPDLKKLNITRCIKMTDNGLLRILLKCSGLQSLNLYALSSLTDKVYSQIVLLSDLRFLDLCGAQNLTDEGLSCIARCLNLTSLNLTWCVHVTDAGMVEVARFCDYLEFLSLFGIVGVTDSCLEELSKFCRTTLTTLDVNGCINIKEEPGGLACAVSSLDLLQSS